MKYNFDRKLGKFGPSVSPIGFGAMSLTNFYGSCNDNQANEILNAVLNKTGGDNKKEIIKNFENIPNLNIDEFDLDNKVWKFGYESE